MRANYCNLKCGEKKKSDKGKITTRKLDNYSQLRYAFDNVMRKKSLIF